MIAVLPFIEGAMAIEVIDAICVVVKSIQSIQSISQQSTVDLNSQSHLFQNLNQGGLSSDGSINQQILYNDHLIYDQEFQLLMNEQVQKVTRHCQSLWNVVPSGLATLFTWTFSGQASRQEFIMFQTENHVGSIEFNKTKQGNRELSQIDIRVFSYSNSVEFEEKHKKLLQGRPYERCLGTVNQVRNIYFHQINSLIYLQTVCWRQIEQRNPKYLTFDPCHKISKQLARSIFYFCHAEPDYDWVLQSIFGCFTDKPMLVPHLDMILVEKTIWNGQKLNSERMLQIDNFKSMLKDIRAAPQSTQMQG